MVPEKKRVRFDFSPLLNGTDECSEEIGYYQMTAVVHYHNRPTHSKSILSSSRTFPVCKCRMTDSMSQDFDHDPNSPKQVSLSFFFC
ncbi:unnamed protein product [Dracunculus medinensis]|uniref:Velvet domain-containing protein n=1 Tax=Dracunculus medinensis TaxID=318479 RepID=A0A0N4U7N7_DRAME|nr:unnamed protein product [Dracunculus medinensis]